MLKRNLHLYGFNHSGVLTWKHIKLVFVNSVSTIWCIRSHHLAVVAIHAQSYTRIHTHALIRVHCHECTDSDQIQMFPKPINVAETNERAFACKRAYCNDELVATIQLSHCWCGCMEGISIRLNVAKAADVGGVSISMHCSQIINAYSGYIRWYYFVLTLLSPAKCTHCVRHITHFCCIISERLPQPATT